MTYFSHFLRFLIFVEIEIGLYFPVIQRKHYSITRVLCFAIAYFVFGSFVIVLVHTLILLPINSFTDAKNHWKLMECST